MKLRFLLPLFVPAVLSAQISIDTARDERMIRSMYDIALEEQNGYQWLESLCKDVGPRLAGSEGADKAVEWAIANLNALGFDTVYTQEVEVPHWERGPILFRVDESDEPFAVCALGGSVSTDKNGLTAQVIEMPDIADLANYSREDIEGKFVYFSAPMRQTYLSTGSAYGEAVQKRHMGAVKASEYGAAGVIIRSVTTKKDDEPHTGSMTYNGAEKEIPAVALGYLSANRLSEALRENPNVEVTLTMENYTYESKTSYNVIGEVRGSTLPNEISIAGGHLDSWDLAEGAQDDGAGVVQSMEAIHLMLRAGYRPKRTHRVVLFMNEEFGLTGAREYARLAKENNELHLVGIESDGGGDVPRGYSIQAVQSGIDVVKSFRWFLEPYGLHEYAIGWSGADVGQLRNDGTILLGYKADNQRYFDYHHAPTDTFESVNARALELGSASMAAILYLLDVYEVRP